MTHFLLLALQQPAGGSSGGLMMLLLQVVAIGAIFYFLILRPQGKARKEHAALLAQLKRNDEVMTAGGIVGKVKEIKDVESNGVTESLVTIESGTTQLVVERSRIVRIGGPAPGRR
ncbi:MAG TPA: preprotein translocase subunit YajC [Gemmatimonadales bacterium]|nr:preprotein translocase subunit YajC [Gemmatimonadales bacterium]